MTTPLSPLKQAFLALEEMQARLAAAEQAKNAPIAVVGIGCRFPGGAGSPEVFWQNLRSGVDGIRDVPPGRWDVEAVYDPNPDAPGKTYARQAGFLDSVDQFDPQLFGIAPREAVGMDPQQRLLLEVAWEALEHAGIAPDRLSGSRTGVFVGIASLDYANLYTKANDLSLLDAYYGSGVAHSIASGRISYVLGLQGPSISLDTACSSSLVAVHLAVQSLRLGECSLALAGGVNLILQPDNSIAFSKLRMLSADSRCRTFDARADGFADGEGCGIVVLKRLADAQAAGDRILAVIRGSAVNQDGPSSGLTAPNGPAQTAVIRAALENGAIPPGEVGCIEAHGTGTTLGDPIEVQALSAALGEGRPAERRFYLGSVKTNLGHLEAAAGVAGLIKAVLMVQHGEIFPHLNFETPNPFIAWDEVPAVIPTALTPWPAGYERRIAGVSSFGFSGTNAHILVEAPPAAPPEASPAPARPLTVMTLSGRGHAALRAQAERLQPVVAAAADQAVFADIAYTLNTGRARLPSRLALVAASAGQAAERLAAYLEGQDSPGLAAGEAPTADPPKVAFLFTGQGAQYLHMGRRLYETEPVFREALERCAALLQPWMDVPLIAILYPESASPEQAARIDHTAYTQPALFAIEYALAQLWMSWGVAPSAVMGHSVGEFVAAVIAGVFSLEDGLKLIAARGRLMGALPEGGAMAAVFAGLPQVEQAIAPFAGQVSLAAVNGPDNIVISGEQAAVQSILESLKAQGIKARSLKVSHAFHSPLMEAMLDPFEQVARQVSYSAPRIRLVSDVTGEFARPGQVTSARYWRDHVRQPVQFSRSLETLYREGYSVFLEIGPSPTLTGMGQRVLAEASRPLAWVSSLKQGQDDWQGMLAGLGALFVHGVEVDFAGLDRAAPRRKLALPTYPFQRARYWVDFPTSPGAQAIHRRKPGGHPLLGSRLRSPARTVQFESWLSAAAFSFLNDHRVFERAILPGTGFIELALAAGRETLGDDLAAVEDLTIHAALAVDDDEERLLQAVVTPGEDGAARLEIYTQGDESEPWLLHATAALRPAAPPPELAESPAEIQARCPETISGEAHYQRLAESGLAFGESLKGVVQLWRRDGEALGRIQPTAAVAAEGGYLLHPALLDAHLQTLAAALPATPDVYLPIHFERIQRCQPGQPAWGHVRVQEGGASRQTVRADLRLMDESGMLLAEITGITLKRAERSALHKPGQALYQDWLYQIEWQPAPRAAAAPARRVSPEQLAAQLDPALARLSEQHGLDEYVNDLLPEFDRLARIYIVNALLKLGWQPAAGERFEAEALAARLKILPQHGRLFGQLLRILAQDGFLQPADGGWLLLRPLQAEDALSLHAALTKLFPQYEGELEITGRCGAQLAEALSGKADPLHLLFPGGGLDTAEKIYQKSPAAQAYNGLIRSAVEAILQQIPSDQRLRVLEIGAGTGGTSSFVLPVLPAGRTEYTYTDISPLFVARAQQKFSQFPFVRYQTLDIEKDPAAQGLAGQQFDLVIAANVIHATQDLSVTLGHIRRRLAPDGLLVMLEVTAPQRWVDLTFGLTDGWWRFSDRELRPDYPLLSRPQWIELLRAAGFSEAATIPQVAGQAQHLTLEEAVIIARGPSGAGQGGWLIFSEGDDLGQALAAGLQARGEAALLAAADPESLPALLARQAPLKDVVFLSPPASPVASGEAPALKSALALIQGLAAAGGVPPRLWLVTRGAQTAGESPAPDPAGAALWGLGKTAALEHPELRCTRLDLDPADPQPVESLLAELLAPSDGEDEIRLRGAARFAARLAPFPPPAAAAPQTLAITERGALDSLAWQPLERRSPGPGEVEIRVQAAGLNFKDVMMALGMYPGAVTPLGGECAGVISAVGAGVTELQAGDPVMAIASASFSTHAVTTADFTARQPASLSTPQAASSLIPFITASFALEHLGQMQPGEKVLIHAGAGGVGLAAIQLAQRRGLEIFATAGNPEKRAYLQSLGVPHVMDSRSLAFADEIMQLTAGRGVDLVLNSLAGEFIPRSLGVLAENGRFLELGKSGLLSPEQAAALGRGIRYFIIDWTDEARAEPALISGILRRIVSDLASGSLRPLPVRAFPMSGAVAAFRTMQQARHIGKIVVVQPPDGAIPPARPDAAYLVTGGLRGLGLLTARWLAERGARHLALIGRSQPSPAAQEAIQALQAAGVQVLALQGDVAVEADVRRLLAQVQAGLPPLRGVIHAAGLLDDAALINQSWERFTHVLGPKAAGASLLHRLTEDQPLDFFILYSSVAAVFGSRGQANHAAANAYMDALAHHRRAHGLPALSINWGVWAEVGAAADRGAVERSAQQGIESMPPQDGLNVLAMLMQSGADQVVVSPMNWPRFLQGYGEKVPPYLSGIARQAAARRLQPAPARAAPAQPEFLRRLDEAPADRKRSLLLGFIQAQAAKVLGLEARAVNERMPLNEMGLDSLMAVELRNLLGTALGLKRPLPVTLVFDYPTVEAITDYLAKEALGLETPAAPESLISDVKGESGVLDSIEDLSDDEVDRLLAEMTKGKA
jgi:acyl transferase domain-containing protein/NAD(P)-dependent dehydrogenase (short-subunit alcohol dehydrogenase family)/phospholipid N-methyltransferase